MSELSKTTRHFVCPTCGHKHVHPDAVLDGIRLVRAGVRLSAAARAAGISKQRLSQIIKARSKQPPKSLATPGKARKG